MCTHISYIMHYAHIYFYLYTRSNTAVRIISPHTLDRLRKRISEKGQVHFFEEHNGRCVCVTLNLLIPDTLNPTPTLIRASDSQCLRRMQFAPLIVSKYPFQVSKHSIKWSQEIPPWGDIQKPHVREMPMLIKRTPVGVLVCTSKTTPRRN